MSIFQVAAPAGFCHAGAVRRVDLSIAILIASALPAAAVAAPATMRFSVPAGTLGDVAIALAQQADVTIGLTDPALAKARSPGVSGRMSIAAALRAALAGLPARAEPVDGENWRIVAAARQPSRPSATAGPLPTAAPPPPDLIVIGSKMGTAYGRYAGTAHVVNGDELSPAETASGTLALARHVPTLTQTHLGSGRNKLFIRGIADSSFNGPSQATVGQYFGDVRMTYNAPDPDISLYDVSAVEVLEGPQGTLYGVGALGGVVRIVPTPVDLADNSIDLAAGTSTTAHGAAGHDLAGVANLALKPGIVGIRAVAFDTVEAGYIDDPGRGLRNINRTHKSGGRVEARAVAGPWRIDAGAIIQNVAAADGQYADRSLAPLERRIAVAQPFDNDYLLAHADVARNWGTLALVSATGFVHQSVDSRYDFTRAGDASPRIFDQHNRIQIVSHETRLSHRDDDGAGWVAGATFLYDRERLTRALGTYPDPPRILGVENSVTEGALFGEAGWHLRPNLVGTLGARIEIAHLAGAPLDRAARTDEPDRTERAFLPAASLSWRPSSRLQIYGRYQEGFRVGGLAVVPDTPQPSVQRYAGDSLSSFEVGAKWGGGRLKLGASLSYARWENIQADLIDMAGLPYSDNIGTGRILGAEANADWHPSPALRLTAALFLNDSQLTSPSADFAADRNEELPNVAHVGLRGGIDYRRELGGGWRLDTGGSVRYTGHSRLGYGLLDIVQGGYTLVNISTRIGTERWGISLDCDNLLDSQGSTFALGNPFGVAGGNQIVPPRPRTVRIGIDAHF